MANFLNSNCEQAKIIAVCSSKYLLLGSKAIDQLKYLFTIAKIWIQPKCPSVHEWVQKALVHLHNGILHSLRKEIILAFCDSIDETGDYYVT